LLKIDQFIVNEFLTTSTSLVLNLDISNDTKPFFESLEIIVPGHQSVIIDSLNDQFSTQITIPDLYYDSEYHLIAIFTATGGSQQIVRLTGVTKDDPNNKAPVNKNGRKKHYPKIIGREF
jgi:hypothetical protein